MTDCILHALQFDGQGGARSISPDEIPAALDSEAVSWVHLDANFASCRDWLLNKLKLPDELIIDALLAEETRPRLLSYEEGAMVILRGVNLNDDAHPEDMVSVRMWIYGSNIISVRLRRLKAVIDIRERLENGRGPKNTGDFLTTLIMRLFERMEPVLRNLDDQLDILEEQVMENPNAEDRQGITTLRKQAILFKRYIAPQRDVIASLRNAEFSWLEVGHKRKLMESLDRVTRYIEDLDATRERGQIIKDELGNALSDRMNRNLYMLSVVAAIFLPLGFLTGLLGINVAGIPGSDVANAFFIFCAILIGVVVGQVYLFKRLKWF
jgi:zinc transporter